jgi:hypothetical protein
MSEEIKCWITSNHYNLHTILEQDMAKVLYTSLKESALGKYHYTVDISTDSLGTLAVLF